MSSKYISGTYASGYTLTGTYSTVTIGTAGSIGGVGLVGDINASYAIVNLGRIAASTAGASGILLRAGGTIANGSTSNPTALVAGVNGGFDGTGGVGIVVSGGGSIGNWGRVAGGNAYATAPGSTSAAGGTAITLSGGGSVSNSGTIAGGFGSRGGVGISLSDSGGVSNSGTIAGGTGYFGGIGGVGVVLADGGSINNSGTIAGGDYFNASYGIGRGAAGIVLSSGGSIDNSGKIAGGLYAAGVVLSRGGSISNSGTITGRTDGIVLSDGGSVSNSGKIAGGGFGGHDGIALSGGGSVSNSGTVAAGTLGDGIVLSGGGSIGNSGTIVGGTGRGTGGLFEIGIIPGVAGGTGISMAGGGRIDNSGTIAGGAGGIGNYGGSRGGVGIMLDGGGSVSNSGMIAGGTGAQGNSGGIGIQAIGTAGATVINFGTIASLGGTSGTAISFAGSGPNKLALGHGFLVTGVVRGSTAAGATDTLELLGSADFAVTVDYNGLRLTNFEKVLFGTGGNAKLLVSNASGTLGVTISGFEATSEIIDLTQIGADGTITSSDTTTDRMTVTGSLGSVTLQFDAIDGLNFTTTGDGGSGTELIACFCRGTLILTETGEVPVEELAVGDRVKTLSGACKSIVWIGLGRSLVTRANRLARPIVVRQGALADNVPHRDLYLTHGHALYLDGVLIPVENLVNHRTILWDDTARVVEYYHIELADHDVVFAQGAPAETYYDANNRALFQNTREGSEAGAEKATCAPVLNSGEIVENAWAALFERAGGQFVCNTTDDPDIHLLVDGERLDPTITDDGVYSFQLDRPPAGTLRLCSRSGVPSLLGFGRSDHRPLGVVIRQIVLWHAGIPTSFDYDAPQLREGGCHPPEDGYCWTDGEFELPARFFTLLNGAFTVAVHTERAVALVAHTERHRMRYPIRAGVVAAAHAAAA